MVINVYKLQRLAANERMAGAVAQGKRALRNSARALPWRRILSPPVHDATGDGLPLPGCGHAMTKDSQIRVGSMPKQGFGTKGGRCGHPLPAGTVFSRAKHQERQGENRSDDKYVGEAQINVNFRKEER